MLQDLFRAILTAGVPVGIATYLLVWWALQRGYIGPATTVRDVERRFKRLTKAKSAARK